VYTQHIRGTRGPQATWVLNMIELMQFVRYVTYRKLNQPWNRNISAAIVGKYTRTNIYTTYISIYYIQTYRRP